VVILNSDLAPESIPLKSSTARTMGTPWFGAAETESWTSAARRGRLCSLHDLGGAAQERSAPTWRQVRRFGWPGAFGGVLPLAASMNGAAFLGIETEESKILGASARVLRHLRQRSR